MIVDKLFAIMAAILIYLVTVGLLLFYFAFHHSDDSIHFVDKNKKGIEVSLANPKPSKTPATINPKLKESSKPKVSKQKSTKHTLKRTNTPSSKRDKKVKKIDTKPKKIKNSKVVKKKKLRNRVIKRHLVAKKPDTKKLFKSIKKSKQFKARKKVAQKSHKKREGLKSLNKNRGQKGIENAYLAKVERLLRGWPAQVNFAGEEMDIHFKIYPDGHFNYDIVRTSGNPDFNYALTNYLKQLQRFGFGAHYSDNRTYDINVKFVAHE